MTQVSGIPKQLVQTQTTDLGPQIIYNSPSTGKGTIISAVTVSNCEQKDNYFAATIGPTTPNPSCDMIPNRLIKGNRTDPAPELIGQIIPPGQALWVQNDSLELLFTVSGRELD